MTAAQKATSHPRTVAFPTEAASAISLSPLRHSVKAYGQLEAPACSAHPHAAGRKPHCPLSASSTFHHADAPRKPHHRRPQKRSWTSKLRGRRTSCRVHPERCISLTHEAQPERRCPVSRDCRRGGAHAPPRPSRAAKVERAGLCPRRLIRGTFVYLTLFYSLVDKLLDSTRGGGACGS